MTTLIQAKRDATWRERAATVSVFLALGLGVGAWAAALPSLKLTLSLSDRDLSLALLGVSVGSVLSTIATGAIAPRFGTGRSTGVAALAAMMAFALPALAGSLGQLSACGFMIGVTCGALDIAVNGHASEIERRWNSPIMSSFHAAFSAGGLIGSALGGFLVSTGWGLHGQLWLPLAGAMLLVLVALPWLGTGARDTETHGTGLAWPERAAAGLCAIALFCFMIEGAVADWSGVYLSTVTGAGVGMAAAGYAAFSTTMVGGRLVGDWVVRALGPRRVVVYGGATAAVGMALAVLVPQPVPTAVGFALVGLGAANVVPVLFSAAGRFGSSPSAGVAMVATFGYAGFLGGPPLIGAVATWAGLRAGLALLFFASLSVALGGLRVEGRAPGPERR